MIRLSNYCIFRHRKIAHVHQGIYRLLYASKKPIAKKFRKWAGNILDDITFNESEELKRQ